MGRRELLRDRGSVTVEFFLVLPLLILVLFSSVQVIALARTRVELIGAVREGARVAATAPDPARAVSAVEAAMAPEARRRLRVSVSRPAVVGRPARVEAVLRQSLLGPFLGGIDVDLRASASMLVER